MVKSTHNHSSSTAKAPAYIALGTPSRQRTLNKRAGPAAGLDNSNVNQTLHVNLLFELFRISEYHALLAVQGNGTVVKLKYTDRGMTT